MSRTSRIPPEAFDRLSQVVPLGRDAAAVRKRLEDGGVVIRAFAG